VGKINHRLVIPHSCNYHTCDSRTRTRLQLERSSHLPLLHLSPLSLSRFPRAAQAVVVVFLLVFFSATAAWHRITPHRQGRRCRRWTWKEVGGRNRAGPYMRACVCVYVSSARMSSVRVPLLGEGERLFSSPRAFALDGGSTCEAVRAIPDCCEHTRPNLRRHRCKAPRQRGDLGEIHVTGRGRASLRGPRSWTVRFRFIKLEFGRGAANGARDALLSPSRCSVSLDGRPVYCGNLRSTSRLIIACFVNDQSGLRVCALLQ